MAFHYVQYLAASTILGFISISAGVDLYINTTGPIFKVDPEFISATLDFQMIDLPPDSRIPRWFGFDFNSERIRTLLKGLSPCYLRFGGTGADMTIFSNPDDTIVYNQPTQVKIYNVFPQDIDNLVSLARAAGARLLYDLNLNLRYISDWDPTNALKLMRYIIDKGYADIVDFELGNESNQLRPHVISPWPWPPYVTQDEPMTYDNKTKQTLLGGNQIGHDYLSLITLMKNFPSLSKSKIVGPDLAGGFSGFMPDFLKVCGNNITASTFHHYYFNGHGAAPSEYVNIRHFDALKSFIQELKDIINKYSPNKQLPLWNGETADAYDSGTPNVTNRFISGFLWLDKLGLSAQMGVSVVMRQTFSGGYYGLIDGQANPNPDYWVSYVHKVLVGRTVLNTSINEEKFKSSNEINYSYNHHTANATQMVRLYAHCTRPSQRYSSSEVTVFGLNIKNESVLVSFKERFSKSPIDQYLLSPYGPEGLLSQQMALNGQLLNMVDDKMFPELIPKRLTSGTKGLKFPPKTFVFWVFVDVNLRFCQND